MHITPTKSNKKKQRKNERERGKNIDRYDARKRRSTNMNHKTTRDYVLEQSPAKHENLAERQVIYTDICFWVLSWLGFTDYIFVVFHLYTQFLHALLTTQDELYETIIGCCIQCCIIALRCLAHSRLRHDIMQFCLKVIYTFWSWFHPRLLDIICPKTFILTIIMVK